MKRKKGGDDGLEYFQMISINGLVDIKDVENENVLKDEDIAVIKKSTKILYHYNGPVTIYDKVFTRVDDYIHAFSKKQALFLLKEKFAKEHPKINNAARAWFDSKYIIEEK